MIDNERGHRNRSHSRWVRKVHAEGNEWNANREAFRQELNSYQGGV